MGSRDVMIGIGKMWKAVTRSTAEVQAPVPLSTIPRDLASLKASPVEPLWDDAEPNDTRSAERFVPLRTTTMLHASSGRRVTARIINISRTGVAVEADFAEMSLADVAIVGSRPVTPGRRITLGAVFLFKKPLDPKLCDPSIIL